MKIVDEIKESGLDNRFEGKFVKTNNLIEYCYKIDENQMPSVYRLLSIEEIIENYDPNVHNINYSLLILMFVLFPGKI